MHAPVQVDYEKIGRANMHQSCHALCGGRNHGLVDRLQEALCTIELDEAEPAGNRPDDVVACYSGNFRILCARYQDGIHEEEKYDDRNQVRRDDYSAAVEVNATLGLLLLSVGPGYERFDGTNQAHRYRENQDIKQHVSQSDGSQQRAIYLPDVHDIQELNHLKEDHGQYRWCGPLANEPKAHHKARILDLLRFLTLFWSF